MRMKRTFTTSFLMTVLLVLTVSGTYAQCNFSGLNANYCTNSAATNLVPGTGGGTFIGPGISGSSFNPALAGPGTHTINYSICASTYTITNPAFAPLPTTGNTLALGSFSAGGIVNNDDGTSAALPIGFNFQFFCNTYSTFYICTNGFITFTGGQASPYTTVALPSTGAPYNMIGVPWADYNLNYGGTITYTTVGTAPNRRLLVSYIAIAHHNSGNGAIEPDAATIQLMLYETTNVIEVHITALPLNTAGSYNLSPTNHMMGIQNANGTVAYAVTGRNTATWSAFNECTRWTPGTTCSVSQTTAVSPTTISVAGNNTICAGSTASLTATGNVTYTWSTSSNNTSITVSPVANQAFSVSGTNSFGCLASTNLTVYVDQTPTVTATSSGNSGGSCPGKTVSVTGSGATSYTWTGATPTITNGVAFTPGTSATYTVTGGNACGTATAAVSVSIHPLPLVIPAASASSLCTGNSLTLTASGNASTYTWTGGATTITNGIGFVPATTATYVLTGTSALSCTAAATIPVTVYVTPTIAPVASPSVVCLGNSATLTAIGALNYTWSSSSQTVNTSAFVITPASAGVSSYTITKATSNCSDTKVISITTQSLPTISAIAMPGTICALSPATLAVGGALTYTWTAPGTPNYTFTGSSNIVSPPVSTNYTVAGSDGTCVAISTVSITTNPNPTISISASTLTLCNGQSVTLNASGGNSYTWTAGSTTLSGSSITQTPSVTASFNVVGDNGAGCTAQTSQIIFVNSSPNISVTSNKNLICSGTPISFTATGASTYTWDANANNTVANSVTVTPVSLSSGLVIYSVQGTSSVGCVGSQTAQANIFVPIVSVSGNTNTCRGSTVSLTAAGANSGSYTWTTGSSAPVNNAVITATLTAPSVFTVSANTTSLALTCPVTRTVATDLYPDPVITATVQRTPICLNESVELYAHGGVNYTWNTTATGATIVVKPSIQTTYTVTGTDNNGCHGTGTVQVKMSSCVGLNNLSAGNTGLSLYPNPNTGEFIVESTSDIRLTLVNELGQLIQGIELSAGNNYKVTVSDLAKGVYFLTGRNDSSQINQKVIVYK